MDGAVYGYDRFAARTAIQQRSLPLSAAAATVTNQRSGGEQG
jgi:hypothetical protein